MVKTGFVNIDDPKGEELIVLKPDCSFKTYSVNKASDKKASNININNVIMRIETYFI